MPQAQMSAVVRFIRRVRSAAVNGGASDSVLLERFVKTRNEEAFIALVERHGAMVLSVCRRVLQNLHDAEDAFQATFLVLARRAAAIRNRASLASWLYGVAFRVARKAQVANSSRRTRERQIALHMPREISPADGAWRELRTILDDELSRLPEKYRAPLVLCYLEGKTNEEAAEQLGWTKGTVSGRLARARDLLRSRLTRRGLTLSAGMLVGLFGAGTAPAAVPGTLLNATVQAATSFAAGKAVAAQTAAALAEGAVRAMFASKCKIVLGVALCLALAGGGAGIVVQGLTSDGTGPATVSAAVPAPGQSLAKKELTKLQGTWLATVGGGYKGKMISEEDIKRAAHKFVVAGEKFKWYTAIQDDPVMEGTIRLDPTTTPKSMDLTFDGQDKLGKCIYEVNGSVLRFCYAENARPTEFKTRADNADLRLYVWKREKAEGAPQQSGPGQADGAARHPVPDKPIVSSNELRGKWTGAKNGIKVDLTFYAQQERRQAYWQVEFKKTRKPEFAGQSPTVGVSVGADLTCAAEAKTGRLNLHLPATRKIAGNWDPASRKLVGQVERSGPDAIQLRIIPTGIVEDPATATYDYPAVDGLVLQRVSEAVSKRAKAEDARQVFKLPTIRARS